MKKIRRAAVWCAANGGLAICLYFAGAHGAEWAENILTFVVWLYLPAWIMVAIDREFHQELYNRGSGVPPAIRRSFDVGMVVGMIAIGWSATGIAYVVSALCKEAVFSEPPKKKAEA